MPTAAERYKFADVEKDGKSFISDVQKLCKVYSVVGVKQDILSKNCNKDVLAEHLERALALIERQHNLVINQRVHISGFQSDIIKLQGDLIDTQKKSMDKFQDSVIRIKKELSETVQDTVKSSVSKSYSEVVKSQESNSPVIGNDTLKSVAKQVVAEEELSRNIMVFGLQENENENLAQKIDEVFECLGEKPRVEASRLGKKRSETAARPVKVTLSSSTFVQLILSKSRMLRTSEKHKSVFLSPDRAAEERLKQKELVTELKEKIAQDSQKRHFIRGGKIITVDK